MEQNPQQQTARPPQGGGNNETKIKIEIDLNPIFKSARYDLPSDSELRTRILRAIETEVRSGAESAIGKETIRSIHSDELRKLDQEEEKKKKEEKNKK